MPYGKKPEIIHLQFFFPSVHSTKSLSDIALIDLFFPHEYVMLYKSRLKQQHISPIPIAEVCNFCFASATKRFLIRFPEHSSRLSLVGQTGSPLPQTNTIG